MALGTKQDTTEKTDAQVPFKGISSHDWEKKPESEHSMAESLVAWVRDCQGESGDMHSDDWELLEASLKESTDIVICSNFENGFDHGIVIYADGSFAWWEHGRFAPGIESLGSHLQRSGPPNQEKNDAWYCERFGVDSAWAGREQGVPA